MSAPLLAVLRAGQQAIDDRRERLPIRRRVGQERLDLVRCGGQPRQVEGGAADQCPAVGARGGGQPLLRDPPIEEGIDRVGRDITGSRRRGVGMAQRLIGPQVLGLVMAVGPVIGKAATGRHGEALGLRATSLLDDRGDRARRARVPPR